MHQSHGLEQFLMRSLHKFLGTEAEAVGLNRVTASAKEVVLARFINPAGKLTPITLWLLDFRYPMVANSPGRILSQDPMDWIQSFKNGRPSLGGMLSTGHDLPRKKSGSRTLLPERLAR